MCGKSMLGSLYLSILLISCISFDFGSANSSGEEIEVYNCPFEYHNLTDSWRKIGGGSLANECDKDPPFDGETWFRFVEPAGIMLPTSEQEDEACGTGAVAWMDGLYPTTIGEPVYRKICFSFNGISCRWSVDNTQVAACKDYDGGLFYVYKFQETPVCYLAYCAVESVCTRNSDCQSNACDTVTGECYEFSSDSFCDGERIDRYIDSLDAATSECNKNIECNCLCTCYDGDEYCLFKGTTVQSNPNGLEAWVKQ